MQHVGEPLDGPQRLDTLTVIRERRARSQISITASLKKRDIKVDYSLQLYVHPKSDDELFHLDVSIGAACGATVCGSRLVAVTERTEVGI